MLKKILTLLVLTPLLTLPAAASDPAADAQAFVRDGIDQGIAILKQTEPDDPARTARFRTFVADIIDTRSVALFALGHYRKSTDPQTLAAYIDSFTAYATASYESRLGLYGGQTISVTEAIVNTDTDVLVSGEIQNAQGKQLADVAFRVLTTPRGPQLFDVRIAGIWLAVEQRSQFGSYIAQNGGDVQALIDFLNEETARLRSGDTTTVAAEG